MEEATHPGRLLADRVAVVTDLGWVRKATTAFGWLAPGELRVFPLAELDQAKAWVGGG